jgi:DNA-directed RNA polymerase subunit RPC12/RpoP
VTARQRCMACGAEGWTETMRFCPTDGMWVCAKCAVHLGLADPRPRCPRCYSALVSEASSELVSPGSEMKVEVS